MHNCFQQKVEEWVSQYKLGYFEPEWILAQMQEEAGEIAREVQDKYGPKKKKVEEKRGDLEEEIGDLFFVLLCLLNREGMSLDRAFEKTMEKKWGRDKNRWQKK